MMFLPDRWRLPWPDSGLRLSLRMLIPILVPPMLVLMMSIYSVDGVLVVSSVLAGALMIFMYTAKRDSRHLLFYYWIAASITYVIIVFEFIVVPLAEIENQENFLLILFIALALLFLNWTKQFSNLWHESEIRNGDAFTSDISSSSCPICRSKANARSYHCYVCQVCVAKYDHHSYWLNCCIGESNQHFFVVGVFFSVLALGYASLLILTTICEPEFIFGILLPKDCSGVGAITGMFASFVCGIYCLELTFLLLIHFARQVWLISIGYSATEWRDRPIRNFFQPSPYSRGFVRNWYLLFQNMRKMRL